MQRPEKNRPENKKRKGRECPHAVPQWWCQGLIPVSVVCAPHYAPFACILIDGIFRNKEG